MHDESSNKNIKIIDLDMYGSDFRRGYDAASVTSAMRDALLTVKGSGKPCMIYVKIHKDSIPTCQGICAENMVHSQVVAKIHVDSNIQITKDETWLLLAPNVSFWK